MSRSSPSGRKRKSSFSSQGSPSKKPKLAIEGLIEDAVGYDTEFQKGQIVRIALTNWVTFDQTEIDCEPGLNLIVGPNGTGKSSIVCAICLGLGGKPRSLGRGEKAQDFIKYGRQKAIIEIELYNPSPSRNNDIIKRFINKAGTKWSINGKSANAGKVEQFVKEQRNIKVDNLCQFLAQDRVSEFARLTPKELLIETEKAIEDDQLYKWHQFLIDEGEKASNSQNEIENLKQSLGQNQAEIETLQKTIEQFESRKTMQEQMINYQALHEWTKADNKHKEYKLKMKITKKLHDKYQKKKSNVVPMQKEEKKWKKKSQTMSNKISKHTKEIKKTDQKRLRAIGKVGNLAEEIKHFEDKIKQIHQDLKARAKRIKKIREEMKKLQHEYDNFDHSEIENAKKEKQRITRDGLRESRKERNKIDTELKRINNQKSNIEHNLNLISQQLESWTNETKRKEAHIFGNNRSKEKRFKLWVDQHRHEFHGQVFGPIVSEMTVKQDLFATFLNSVIASTVFYGYVCTDSRDWQTLLREAGKYQLQITVYTSANNHNNNNNNNNNRQQIRRRPVDHQILHQYEVDGYLDEIYEAPDVIKQVLNDNLGLHQRAYAMQEPSNQSLDNILVTYSKQQGRLKSLITPNTTYNIKESHYSSNVLRAMNAIQRHRNPILQTTPDYSQQIHDKQQEQKNWYNQLDIIEKEKKNQESKRSLAVTKITKLNNKKKELETIITKFTSITNKLHKKERDLEELEKEGEGENDPNEIEKKLVAIIEKKNIERIATFSKLTDDISLLVDMMKINGSYLLAKKHYDEESKHCKQKIEMIKQKNGELRAAFDESRRDENRLKQEYDRLLRMASQKYPRKKYNKNWSVDDKKLTLEEIMDKINHLQGRINVLFIDQERVNRYHRLQNKIDSQSRKLSELENKQSAKEDMIKSIENDWKPQLQEAVDKISYKFSQFFAQFNSAEGKVELVWKQQDNDRELPYSEWCIDILTKFRFDQPWKRLTSSSQSGGEKSVSTMLYLLSLQQVTTVPFRVVDEINQGMDPINERRIMQILNFECTPRAIHKNNIDGTIKHLPQYFVVTPKLLPRLEYSPCSSVFVIFNGPFQMPQEYWTLNKFVQSQNELNGNHNNNNNNNNNDQQQEETDDDSD